MSRVIDHPILGRMPEKRKVTICVDGRQVQAFEGEPIAAALIAAGIHICRFTTKRNEPRGLYCAIGQCTDCVMTVDGAPNIRTCITPVRNNLKVETQIGVGQWRDATCKKQTSQ
ncbi:(2Fe-2S)-binding protein [Candidatus Bathyarchaeota archaeon]|nr:(2Fe-2S)-binding protein [Candidatus Bathyarchaeota archaeon]